VNGLIIFGIFIAWWIAGGLYASRVARARNLQAQPSVFSAMLRGPLWVREMLIWSTLPPRSFQSSTGTQVEGERTRSASSSTPEAVGIPAVGAVSAITPDPATSELSSQWKPGAQPQITADAAEYISPQIPAPDIGAPQESSMPEADIIQPPVIPLDVSHGIKPPVLAADNSTITPLEVMDTPPPKKLPNQPKKKGTVKVLCPWCEKKQKYSSDAVCPDCNKVNPWLAGAWEASEGIAQNQSEPSLPTSSNQDVPKPMVTFDSPLGPVPVVSEPIVENARILLPADAVKPKRLPGKPVWGSTIKAHCPWCHDKKAYQKDAVCTSCGNQNPWLAEKWKVKSDIFASPASLEQPETQALLPMADMLVAPPLAEDVPIPHIPAPSITETPPVADSYPQAPIIADAASTQEIPEPVEVSPAIPEPTIEIPAIPEPAAVSPVIPEPAIEIPAAPEPAAASDVETNEAPAPAMPSGCPGCGRNALPDLYGQCMFCGTKMGDEA